MRKVIKRLTDDQKARGVIFSSTLSVSSSDNESNTTHEVFENTFNKQTVIDRLYDDKFFNGSQYKYNIIRR
jgi:hypothetical protein